MSNSDLLAAFERQEQLAADFRGLRRVHRILIGVVGVLGVVIVLAVVAIIGNNQTVHDVKANARDDVVRACQTLNGADRANREAFTAQADIFAKLIPPTQAGLDALAQLRSAVPANHDRDCDGDGELDAADYPTS